jgi:hypothetical protein
MSNKHVYWQKYQTTFMQGTSISALCVSEDRLWVGTPGGLYYILQEEVHAADLEVPVTAIVCAPDGSLWVGAEEGLYHHEDDGWTRVADVFVRALCLGADENIWYTDGQVIWANETFQPDHAVRDMLLVGDQLWLATDQGLIAGERRWTAENGLLSNDVRSLMLDGAGHLWAATGSGISIFDRKETWYSLTGRNGLPYEDVHRIVSGCQGERWIAAGIGAACYANGRWEYYAGKRWLPSDEVTAMAVGREGEAWIGTSEGLSRIEKRPYDFEKKAEYFEQRIAARHNRYGYVTSCYLETPGDVNSFVHEASDNDGLWTALYIAAESFCCAVTKDPQARERAQRSLIALMALEEKTTINGFPARAIVRKDEERVHQSHGEWHESSDGEWLWKGDTSSDEIDGHLFAYGVYYDLVADAHEREQIADVVGRIMGYIVDNDFLLIDVDGEPTRWGVWSPRYLNGPWKDQQGLNSLEILAHLKTAYHITGDSRFQDAYRYLVQEHHYALNTIDQKIMPPGIVNHSDDELAFLAYYMLLSYEDDPDLRSLYLLSLERNWQYERPEHCPLWNFIYGALTRESFPLRKGGQGVVCDVEEAVLTLEQIPMDLITWTMRNSHRADIPRDVSPGRFQEPQSVVAIPADERPVMKWNGNPYRLDGGNGGRSEDDGTFYLIAYWLGRYHGFVV